MFFFLKPSFFLYTSLLSIHQPQFFTNFNSSPFVYQVVTPNNKTHYIIGSIHVLEKTDHPLPVEFSLAMKKSKVLVLESNISRSKRYSFTKIVKEHCMFNKKSLADVISAATYSKVDKFLKHHHGNINTFKRYKPWFLAMVLSGISNSKKKFSSSYGVDMFLANVATKEKVPIKELEDPSTVFSLLNQMTAEEQEKFLLSSISKTWRKAGSTMHLVNLWKGGSEFSMHSYLTRIRSISKGTSSFYRLLFDKRNVNMAKRAKEYFTSDTIHLIVVGAGHLMGNNGLLSVLRNSGYTITRLREIKW